MMINPKAMDTVRSSIMGLVVGDALGVPVEFTSRRELTKDPVVGMRSYGTYEQPAGTWSDDSSMTLALMDSITCRGELDYDDIMTRFCNWYLHGDYAARGKTFDIGMTCSAAIYAYSQGRPAIECGGDGEHSNGNGSLMRIMPAALYVCLHDDMWQKDMSGAIEIISRTSSLTHRHIRSIIGCVLYTSLCYEMIHSHDADLGELVRTAYRKVSTYYASSAQASDELDKYSLLEEPSALKNLAEDSISSDGYVVDTLLTSVWCLLNSDSYKECVLKAVNLGDDTDTTAAVAGGLAGLRYGYDSIPKEWLKDIARKDWIEDMCRKFGERVENYSTCDVR